MRFGSKAAWVLCFVWCAWLTAGQVFLREVCGPWTPDLGLVLVTGLVICSGRAASLGLVYCLVATRLATSLEPPAALLAGGWLAFLLARSVAQVLDRGQALARSGAAFGGALLMGLWVAFARHLNAEQVLGRGAMVDFWPLALEALMTAAASGLCALVIGHWLVRLPGLSPLRRQP